MSAESTSVEGALPAPRRLGRYTLGTRVGEGGMGVVYRAAPDGAPTDGSADVAIKVLRPHIAHDPDARLRLAREVTTLSRVSSPRIAAVLDADTEGPAPYIVTEFVPGPPLDQVVADRGPVSGEALVRLGRGLSEALNAIHRAGIVHRDLKPGNVLMVGSDPVVIDFGIAQVADDVRLTMTGLVMGTPGYLSPEVVEGGAVTEATDWWGWAATLAFAASGTPPFGRGPMAVVLDRVIRGRSQLEDVDPALRPLLAAALDPEADRRPHSDEVMRALELYAAHRPVTEALTTHVPRPRTEQVTPDTRLTPQAQQTRVQPVPPTPQTRVAPQQRPLGQTPYGQAPYGQAPYAGPDQAPYASPAPYDAPDRFGQPMRRPDPRIGRPMRSGTLATALVAVVGLAALVPLLSWVVLMIWSVLARTVDHSVTSLVLRRHEAGRRRSDVPLAVIASPWHLFVAVLSTGLAMLLPIAFALAATVITAGGLTAMGVASFGVEHPVPVAVGTALGTLMAWWGPGGLALRRGSRTLVRTLLPSQIASQIVATLLLVGGAALLTWMVLDGGEVSWWPTTWTDAPFSDLIPQMLRP